MTTERVRTITFLLTNAFKPIELQVKDQSHLHAGHAGTKDGRGHFDVRIVSAAFTGRTRIDCHKMVYDALAELMRSDIHALRIDARAP